jgi:hypothetical protein
MNTPGRKSVADIYTPNSRLQEAILSNGKPRQYSAVVTPFGKLDQGISRGPNFSSLTPDDKVSDKIMGGGSVDEDEWNVDQSKDNDFFSASEPLSPRMLNLRVDQQMEMLKHNLRKAEMDHERATSLLQFRSLERTYRRQVGRRESVFRILENTYAWVLFTIIVLLILFIGEKSRLQYALVNKPENYLYL